MVRIEQKERVKRKNLIFRLNYVYSGLHGQVKCLLQFVNDYFSLKKLNQNQIAQEILTIIVVKIEQIIAIKEVVAKLGGDIEILSYISNTYQYHKEKLKREPSVDKLFLEQISSEMMLIKECENAVCICENQKVKDLLTTFIKQNEKNIRVIDGLKKQKIIKFKYNNA